MQTLRWLLASPPARSEVRACAPRHQAVRKLTECFPFYSRWKLLHQNPRRQTAGQLPFQSSENRGPERVSERAARGFWSWRTGSRPGDRLRFGDGGLAGAEVGEAGPGGGPLAWGWPLHPTATPHPHNNATCSPTALNQLFKNGAIRASN